MVAKLSLLESEWSRQPPIATRIDWANPITRGLIQVFTPGAQGVFDREIINRTKLSVPIGYAAVKTGVTGRGFYINGTVASRLSDTAKKSSGDMSLVVLVSATASGALLGVFNTNSVNAVSNYISIEGNSSYSAISTDNSNWSVASGRAAVYGENALIGANFIANGGRDLFINGFYSSSNPTSRNPVDLNETVLGAYNGGSASGYLSATTGTIYLALVYSRLLSPAEHRALNDNPWQIFEPEEIPLFTSIPSGSTNYTLIASGGAYAINGSSSNLCRSKYLQGSGGSYTLSGSFLDIRRSKRIDAQGGSYVYQGAQATITYGVLSSAYTLACLGGSYVISGATAHVLRNKYLALSSGTYTLSGQSVNLLRSYKVSVLGGVYSITGADAHTLKSKQLVAQGGSYTLSGQQAILNKNRLLTATSGVYLIGGSSIIISKSSVGGYPAEADVRLGIVYGASSEYTGTLDIGKKFRLDIATGNVVMVLDGDKVMTL